MKKNRDKKVQNNKKEISLNSRKFIKTSGLGGISLGAMTASPIEEQLEHVTSRVNRNSNPSELRITDLRIAEIYREPDRESGRIPIVRIYTNQGIMGRGCAGRGRRGVRADAQAPSAGRKPNPY